MTEDWEPKLEEAVTRIRTRYDHIGRKTAAPFMAIVYPPEAERAVLKEWRALSATLAPEFTLLTIDVLKLTSRVVQDLGLESLVDSMKDPMPGSNPTAELGAVWTRAVSEEVRRLGSAPSKGRPVVVLEGLAALHPAATPNAVMHALWDGGRGTLDFPVVLLIPGRLEDRRVYSFVGRDEFMYRGDIL